MMTQSYLDRFSGVDRVYGAGALKRFSGAHVCVIGIGGVGGWSAEALARSGVSELTLIDLDEVCVTNINRQIHALTSTVGRSKVATMRERLLDINPELVVHEVERFFTEKTELELLGPVDDPRDFDVVIDAIDHTSRKRALIQGCVSRGIPVITCGAAGGRVDPTLIRVADLSQSTHDGLLRNVKRALRRADSERFGSHNWGVKSVFSVEDTRAPLADAKVCAPVNTSAETLARDLSNSAPNQATTTQPQATETTQTTQATQNTQNTQNTDRGRRACETTYGSLTFVTGAFGFVAAGVALELILSSPPHSS